MRESLESGGATNPDVERENVEERVAVGSRKVFRTDVTDFER